MLDPIWVLGLLAIGAGGALAARAPEAEASAEEPGLRGGILPAALFLVLLGALLRARSVARADVVAFTLAAGLLFTGGALVVRSILLEGRLRGCWGASARRWPAWPTARPSWPGSTSS